jgi:universal stress protein A
MSINFRRILFPTDFSTTSAGALPYAVSLADVFNAELHCLHVVDDAYMYWTAMGPEGVPVGPAAEDVLALGRSRMEAFSRDHLQGLGRPVSTEVRAGRPFAEIIGYARQHAIDLIVLATHGRGAIAHVLLGSTAEKVVRKSSCPVLTIRADGHEFVMP